MTISFSGIKLDPMHGEIPVFLVGEKPIGMKVSAACVAKGYSMGLFFWGEGLHAHQKGLYPLATWESDPGNLDFNLMKPLEEWEEKGLKKVWVNYSDQLPKTEQTNSTHPLINAVRESRPKLRVELREFHEYLGLGNLAKLTEEGRIKGEHYAALEKTKTQISRMAKGESLPPSTQAFLFAMAIVGTPQAQGSITQGQPFIW